MAVQVQAVAVEKIFHRAKSVKQKMMESNQKERIAVHVNIEITVTALQQIVENAKAIVGHDEKGRYRVDTADEVSKIVSRFLLENDFDTYVKCIDHMKD